MAVTLFDRIAEYYDALHEDVDYPAECTLLETGRNLVATTDHTGEAAVPFFALLTMTVNLPPRRVIAARVVS